MTFCHGTKALLKWCQLATEGYEGVHIQNMTTSWRDGLGFCALIHHFRPDLINFASLDPDDAYGNNELAFTVAERHLGIPSLLDPLDMVECELLDRLSILTYLSQFYPIFHGNIQHSSPVKLTNFSQKTSSSPSSRSSSKQSSPRKTPKRTLNKNEPCIVCEQPVFILERLNVATKLLHRTCFKCARCQTQLSVANYYETENGDYCCDVCPDEEIVVGRVVEVNENVADHTPAVITTTTTTTAVASSSSSVESDCAVEPSLTESQNHTTQQDRKSTGGDDDISGGNAEIDDVLSIGSINDSHSDNDCMVQAVATVNNAADDESTSQECCQRRSSDPSIVSPTTTDADNADVDSNVKSQQIEQVEDGKLAIATYHVPVVPQGIEQSSSANAGTAEQLNDQDVLLPLETGIGCINDVDEEKRELENLDEGKYLLPTIEDGRAGVHVIDTESKQLECPEGKLVDEVLSEKTQRILKMGEGDVATNNEIDDGNINLYPNEMNPFGDEDDDDNVGGDIIKNMNDLANNRIRENRAKMENVDSTNPFCSDFDEKEEEVDVVSSSLSSTGPSKPPRIRVSLNPFECGLDEDIAPSAWLSPQDSLSTARVPLSPPSPSLSAGSSTRARRKKRPAPPPPPTISSTSTPMPSPRTSLIYRSSPSPKAVPSRPSPAVFSNEKTTKPPLQSPRRRPAPPRPPSSSSYFADVPKSQKELDNQNRRSQAALMENLSLISSSTSESSSVQTMCSNVGSSVAWGGGQQHETSGSFPPCLSSISPPHDKSLVEGGQWKKKKGAAPPRPIPPKRQVRKLPRKAVRQELMDIEVKQQELERQGVKLEKTIRELMTRTDAERSERGLENNDRDSFGPGAEDLIIQLFDLVNEKNELFRRQTELVYMKRDHRLEEQHADVEHQIRLLMAKPESAKSEEDSKKEEALIERLMTIVSQRNEIVDCLEMDRLREMEEDESFEIHMGEYAAVKPQEDEIVSKKRKKKKEKKRKKKDKSYDADKDIDTKEFPNLSATASPSTSPVKKPSPLPDKEKAKKLKKKILTSLSHATLKKS